MKKNEFDGLTKAVDFLGAARNRVVDISRAVQLFAADAEGTLVGAIDEALEQVRNRLQDSPLEDPVVPPTSNWGAATDNVNPASAEREQLVNYLIDLAVKTNTGGKFKDRSYVESLSTQQLRTIATIMQKVTSYLK